MSTFDIGEFPTREIKSFIGGIFSSFILADIASSTPYHIYSISKKYPNCGKEMAHTFRRVSAIYFLGYQMGGLTWYNN